MKPVLLINTKTLQPPVSPVGLEYVAESLKKQGLPVMVVDLAFEPDPEAALKKALSATEPLLVGLAVRNTDDCSYLSAVSFLPGIRRIVEICHQHSQGPVVLGGGGFSVSPASILRYTGADLGVAGDGEESLTGLARLLARGEGVEGQPGLVYRSGRRLVANPRCPTRLAHLPPPHRRSFDNPRYQREGAIVGVETQRGCPMGCIYCADPVARGRRLRLRPPKLVAREMADLVEQGVTYFHLCDSEFNLSPHHAREVCSAILQAGLAERVRWYPYCSPTSVDRELLRVMKRAGCAGINFGVDSLCDPQLKRLGRQHRLADLIALASWLKEQRIAFIFDLLLGGPGETTATLGQTVENAQRLCSWGGLVGVSLGVRVYANTRLARSLGLRALHLPTFYLSPALGEDPVGLVHSLVGEKPYFFFLSKPEDTGSYNYAGDATLAQAIREGARGAYWHILAQRRGVPL